MKTNANNATETAPAKIRRVNFTYALPGGIWIEREDGDRSWQSSETLIAELGEWEFSRICGIAHGNGLTGIWRAV